MKFEEYNAQRFVEYVHPGIHKDRAFQRKACWSDDACRNYIRDCSYGWTPTPIVVADVQSGINASIDRHDPASEERYRVAEQLKKDLISLDGQNRADALKRLFADDLYLSGIFMDADGKEVYVDNKVFSCLPVRLQDRLKDMKIYVAVYQGCLYDELHHNFVGLNSSEALNPQELRNAIPTEISSYIRNLSESRHVAPMWGKVIDAEKVKRSLDAEWTAKAYLAVLQKTKAPWTLNKSNLDKFYHLGKGEQEGTVEEYSAAVRTRFSNILHQLVKLTENQKKVAQKIWWLCLYVAEKIHDNEWDVTDYDKLFKCIQKLDKKLAQDASKKYANDIKTWEDAGEISTDEPSRTDYYFQWQSDPKSPSCRKKRKKAFFRLLENNASLFPSVKLAA